MNDPRHGWTSASAAAADAACAGRHKAQVGLQSQQTDDAAHGDAIHKALWDGVPDKLAHDEKETFIACSSIETKVVHQFFHLEYAAWRARERRFWITFGDLRHSGQVDVVYRDGLRALVIDYKTLSGDQQESPKNMQLRDLAVLVRENLLVDEVGVCIVQPFATHSPEICVYDRESLTTATYQLANRVVASNDPASKRTPGELQCKFCLAAKLGKCVEYQQWAGQIAPPAIMAALDVPIAQWTPQTRSRAMDAVRQGKKLLETIEDAMRAGLADDPAFCPGWELAPGRKLETISEPEVVFQRFISQGGKAEDFMECVKIIKTSLAVKLANLNGANGKRLSGAMAELLNGCTLATVSEPILRRKDDNGQK